MRILLACVALATICLIPRSAARSPLAPEYRIEIGRIDGIQEVGGLEHADLARARTVVAAIGGAPLPELKPLAYALIKEFGSAEVIDDGYDYIWVIDPETGQLTKICIERDRVVVAPDDDPNPIVVSLITSVVLD